MSAALGFIDQGLVMPGPSARALRARQREQARSVLRQILITDGAC